MTYSSSLLIPNVPGPLSGRVVDHGEIVPGIVFHMDPDALEAEGATYTCPETRRVRGNHFFLCVGVVGELSRWLPLYSKDGLSRTRLSHLGRSGHPKWITSECCFHTEQVWSATYKAVAAAALAGHDLSDRKRRNRIGIDFVPPV